MQVIMTISYVRTSTHDKHNICFLILEFHFVLSQAEDKNVQKTLKLIVLWPAKTSWMFLHNLLNEHYN